MKALFNTIVLVAMFFAAGFLIGRFFSPVIEQKNLLPAKPAAEIIPKIDQKIEFENQGMYLVSRVIDGDTIELQNGERVRYVGINAPELAEQRKPVECFAREAAVKNRELVEGKIVRLERDVSERDKYSRLLRYVFLPAAEAGGKEKMVNAELVEGGFALAATYPPDVKYAELFRLVESRARETKTGLWSMCK